MNRRLSRNGINVIAQRYHEIYIKEYEIHGSTMSICSLPNTSKYVGKRVFDDMVSTLADMLGDDNDAFDRDRFYSVVYHGKDDKVNINNKGKG